MIRTTKCESGHWNTRLEKAREFLSTAQMLVDLYEGSPDRPANSIVTEFVNAGIAASDVICCKVLGRHSVGDNHEEAVTLLGSAAGTSRMNAERYLTALLSRKTVATYSGRHMGSNDIKQVSRAAAFLVQLAEEL